MKFLFINSVCGAGSTGKICTTLAEGLEKDGHTFRIAFGRGDVPNRFIDTSIKIGGKASVLSHVAYARAFDKMGCGSKKATLDFIEWVKKYDPDIIHLHNIHGYYINIEILFHYLKSCGKPIVWTLHDCWSFTGHCAHFISEGCEKWKVNCDVCIKDKNSYPSSLRINSQRNYTFKKNLFCGVKNMTIATPSNWLKRLAAQSYLGDYRIKTVYNGINLDVFKPELSNIKESYNLYYKKIILGVANVWNEQKGLLDFYKLSEMLEDDYRIVLIGLNEKQLKMLPDKIIGIKKTKDSGELAKWYSAADFFVNPTYEDTFPTVDIEAQACGTPVIVYDVAGCREGIKDGITGKCVKNGDVKAIADIVKSFYSVNEACSQKCVENAAFYNCVRMVEDYKELYKTAMLNRE